MKTERVHGLCYSVFRCQRKIEKGGVHVFLVRILDKNVILKKVVKEKLLSQKHWESFSNKTGIKRKAKRSFNAHFKSNSDPCLV